MASVKNYNSNGMWANVYVPENVNENTDVFVFVHGGGTGADDRNNDWNSVIDYQIKQNGNDSIIVMPTMGERYDKNWASNTMDIVESIQSDYGLQNNNVTSCGFSNGGWGATRTTIESIQRNPDLEPQVLFLLDDYGINTQNPVANMLGDGGAEAFVQNDTVVFSYLSKAGAYQSQEKARQLNALVEADVNVIRVVCDDGSHAGIKNNFFRNGLADYTNGTANLPSEGYKYQKANVTVDPTTGEKTITWEDVDVNDINTKNKLFNYLGIDSSGNTNNISLPNTSLSVSERDVLVDLASVQQWRTQLDSINDESIEQLTRLLDTINSLEDSWQGNFSTGFIEDCGSMVKNAQNVHNNMKSALDPLLTDVVNVESDM